jgi:plastocyanin
VILNRKLPILLTSLLVAGLSVFLISCSSDDDSSSGSSGGGAAPTQAPAATSAPAATQPAAAAPTATPGGPITVTIVDFGYSPVQISARAGQAVSLTVRNSGQFPHTFTIDGVVDTPNVSAGASAPVTFTPAAAGTLTFYCKIHGRTQMSGQVVVTAGASAPPSSGAPGTSSNLPAPTQAAGGSSYEPSA